VEPEEFQRTPGIVFDCGRNEPAGFNAAAVDALNDRAVRKLCKKACKRSPAPGDE
jgi:hypothetical protein